jgi:hypothetical protein
MRVGCADCCEAYDACLEYEDKPTAAKTEARRAWRATVIRNPHGSLVLPRIFHSHGTVNAILGANRWCAVNGVKIKRTPTIAANITVEEVDPNMDAKKAWKEMTPGQRGEFLKQWHIMATEVLTRDWRKLPPKAMMLIQTLWDMRELVEQRLVD